MDDCRASCVQQDVYRSEKTACLGYLSARGSGCNLAIATVLPFLVFSTEVATTYGESTLRFIPLQCCSIDQECRLCERKVYENMVLD